MVTVTPASVSAATDFHSRTQMRQDGSKIEQRLRGVLVHAVAGVEDGKARVLFEEPGSAGGVVAQDDGFGTERAESEAGVLQGLAFFDAGGQAGNERRVGAEAFGRQFEAGAGARGGLVKEQGNTALDKNAVARERILTFKTVARASRWLTSSRSRSVTESNEPGL